MAMFKAALVNEVEKLYKKRKALAAVLLSLAVIVLGQLLIVGMRTGFGIRGTGSVEFPILVLSVVANTILPLFTALVAIDSFSGEFSHNIMRVTLTRPVSRFKIFSAKIGAIGIFIAANLLLLFVLATLTGLLFNVNSAGFLTFGKTFLSYLVTIIPLLVLALGIVLLTNIFRSGISVFFISILFFLGFKVLAVVFSQFSGLLITTHLNWFNLWFASSLPVNVILRELFLMIGYAIMLFTAGFYLFDKKEF